MVNAVHYKYPDGALITVKKLSVDRWTLSTLNGRHLGYVAEGAELTKGEKLSIMAAECATARPKCKFNISLFAILV